MAAHAKYSVHTFITYTDGRPRHEGKEDFGGMDLRQARRDAFNKAIALHEVIEQDYRPNEDDNKVKSFVVAVIFTVYRELEEIVFLEGSVLDAQALELFTAEWKAKYKDILTGWAAEYQYYERNGLLTDEEPGIITNDQEQEITVLPEVADYLGGVRRL